MDSYKKLKLEYKGIKDVIDQYSSDGNIGNYTKGLEQGLETDEIENVLYYLNEICSWYQNNIGKIHSNKWVFNADEHDRNKKLLEEINKELKEYDFEGVIKKPMNLGLKSLLKFFLVIALLIKNMETHWKNLLLD